jgi:hypothetical protein
MKIDGLICNTTEFNTEKRSLPFYIKTVIYNEFDTYEIIFYNSINDEIFASIIKGYINEEIYFIYNRFDGPNSMSLFYSFSSALAYLANRFQFNSVDKIYKELESIELLKELSEE